MLCDQSIRDERFGFDDWSNRQRERKYHEDLVAFPLEIKGVLNGPMKKKKIEKTKDRRAEDGWGVNFVGERIWYSKGCERIHRRKLLESQEDDMPYGFCE